MNINEYSDELKREEQSILNNVINEIDNCILILEQNAAKYTKQAKVANNSLNPDRYGDILQARKDKKDSTEYINDLRNVRKELYRFRLLLSCEKSSGEVVKEFKVGLHSCRNSNNSGNFIYSWKNPIFRHYVLNNSSVNFENVVNDSEESRTNYTLLAKNEIKINRDKVVSATNLYPPVLNRDMLSTMKNAGFFSDAYVNKMFLHNQHDQENQEEVNVVYDEFLSELLERRNSVEFKNIVFSIQKKQGEIIQAPYERNMIIQGCAGSGKSMIMLHRIPILLYDNPAYFSRTGVYIITPSLMYIQMAKNMSHQLEISDISMGTIEQYYDFCINKYSGCRPQDYGKINTKIEITPETENYIFSLQCIEDIKRYYNDYIEGCCTSLEKANLLFNIEYNGSKSGNTYLQKVNSRLSELQTIINANEKVLKQYYQIIQNTVNSLNVLKISLRHRKINTIREIDKMISQNSKEYDNEKAKSENLQIPNVTEDLNADEAACFEKSEMSDVLNKEKESVECDTSYFETLIKISDKIEELLLPFNAVKKEYIKNTTEDIYDIIDGAGSLIGLFYMIKYDLSKLEDKYARYSLPLQKDIENTEHCIGKLQNITERSIDVDYYLKIKEESDILTDFSNEAPKKAYEFVVSRIESAVNKNGSIYAIKQSPYIYLQAIYQFRGVPNLGAREKLLAIDEAQGLTAEEIRLLKNINGHQLVMNLYGDVFQHIEGTKGVNNWEELKDVIEYDLYEIHENYRNSAQITEYCNKRLHMNMNAINTTGNEVYEITDYAEFCSIIKGKLAHCSNEGIKAIIVNDDMEANSLMQIFADYEQGLYRITDEKNDINPEKWNVININDAKGLEFASVIVLSGRMSHNQRYIAYTRALAELYIYAETITIDEAEDDLVCDLAHNVNASLSSVDMVSEENYSKKSEVVLFFESKGLKVIDKRIEGGRLWVVGEKNSIRKVINEAISRYNISGKYAVNNECGGQEGWYSKTTK